MKTRMLVLVGIVMCAGLLAAGCGGSDSTTSTTTEETSAVTDDTGATDSSAAVDALRSQLTDQGISESDQDCVIDEVTSQLSPEELDAFYQTYQDTGESTPEADAAGADAAKACGLG
jgi:hypothetical protein